VTLKWAQSQNKVMGDQQKRITISHPYTQFFTHSLRASHQAILVGKNTVLIDKPQLNLRYAAGKNPIIILMDSHLSIDPQKYFPDRQGITVNLIKNDSQGNWKYLQVKNMLKWDEILTQLYSECQIGSILVEGGSAILNTILPTSYWDQAFFIVSPQSIETELPLYAPDCIPGAIEYVQNIRGNQIFKVTPIKVSRKEQNI
jgi:diaminohydroxyphosphoribosylaminopyrimidine deaminase/5-amino-6-(5-phosphoribosylamino)uracil reductase